MLHELLLCLLGHTGSIFVLEQDKGFILGKDIQIVEVTERNLLNQLASLGFFYNELFFFYKQVKMGIFVSKKILKYPQGIKFLSHLLRLILFKDCTFVPLQLV